MPRKSDLSNLPPDAVGKGIQFNIRLTKRQHDLVTAGAAHLGLTASTYVRWLIETGSPQVLAGPSKAEKLKAMSEEMARMMAPLEPIPEHAIVKPRDPSVPIPVVVHAPTNFKPQVDLDAMLAPNKVLEKLQGLSDERTFGQPATPPPGVPASLPPLPAHRAPEPSPLTFKPPQGAAAKPQKLSMELSMEEFEAFYVRSHEPGPKPLELPDDMSDWT